VAVFFVYRNKLGVVDIIRVEDDDQLVKTFAQAQQLKDVAEIIAGKVNLRDNITEFQRADVKLNIFLNDDITDERKEELYKIASSAYFTDRFVFVEATPYPGAVGASGQVFIDVGGTVPPAPPPLFTHYVDP